MLLTFALEKPLLDSPAIDRCKDAVNWISVPERSLPLFTLGFALLLVGYRRWTKPAVAGGLALIFGALYFGAMLTDVNYLAILAKPDNVPITILLIGIGGCLWMAFRQAACNDDCLRAGKPLPVEDKDDKTLVWPDLIYIELICLVLAAAILVVWAILLPAPLEAPSNRAGPPNPSKAPWYFLGLQEMLVYFDPWMAGVLLPGLIIAGLITLPYIDTNPKGNGYYTLRQRPFAITVWLFGFLILWVVLIVFGTFLRGPNWNFFGPFQAWDARLSVPLTNVNLSDYFWIFFLKKPLPANPILRECTGLAFLFFWVVTLPAILARTVLRKLHQQMGPARFYTMAFLLVIMALLPLKMVLRWTLTLKYFVYLPEFNLNL